MFGLFLAGFRVLEVHGLPGLGCGIGSSPPGVLSLRCLQGSPKSRTLNPPKF